MLDIIFIASSSAPLPSCFRIMPLGPKMPYCREHVLLRLIYSKAELLHPVIFLSIQPMLSHNETVDLS